MQDLPLAGEQKTCGFAAKYLVEGFVCCETAGLLLSSGFVCRYRLEVVGRRSGLR